MGTLCIATEVFLVMIIYLYKGRPLGLFFTVLSIISGSLYSLKFFINIQQLLSGVFSIVETDQKLADERYLKEKA